MVHMPACQANVGWLFVSIATGMSHGAPQVTWRRGRGCGKLVPVRPAMLFWGVGLVLGARRHPVRFGQRWGQGSGLNETCVGVPSKEQAILLQCMVCLELRTL